MERNKSFLKTVCSLAVPVALQSMLQASFSVIDQVMIGQLGSSSVAGVGLAGKFSSVFSVLVSAVATVAGIMMSQYMGQSNRGEVRRSLRVNLLVSVGIAGLFTALCLVFPMQLMRLYTQDENTVIIAAGYLAILAAAFLPMAGAALLSTLLRCMEKASLPLYASVVAAILNTGLNYVLIFGRWGMTPMGALGAGIATAVSQLANFLIMLVLFLWQKKRLQESEEIRQDGKVCQNGTEVRMRSDGACQGNQAHLRKRFLWKQYLAMLLPILICEFMWSLGENVYAGIYGHLGTQSCAAMTLINPIQSLMIGALCGLSQAAGVLVGKMLGNQEYDNAYAASKKLIYYGLVGSVVLSVVILFVSPWYVEIYQVETSVKLLTKQILTAYALIAPFKVLNMILGGGIIRSGGRTHYVMIIDLIGTWIFGVPLGLLAAFAWHLSIPYVYFILSLEECVRFGFSVAVFRRRKWMRSLKGE